MWELRRFGSAKQTVGGPPLQVCDIPQEFRQCRLWDGPSVVFPLLWTLESFGCTQELRCGPLEVGVALGCAGRPAAFSSCSFCSSPRLLGQPGPCSSRTLLNYQCVTSTTLSPLPGRFESDCGPCPCLSLVLCPSYPPRQPGFPEGSLWWGQTQGAGHTVSVAR